MKFFSPKTLIALYRCYSYTGPLDGEVLEVMVRPRHSVLLVSPPHPGLGRSILAVTLGNNWDPKERILRGKLGVLQVN